MFDTHRAILYFSSAIIFVVALAIVYPGGAFSMFISLFYRPLRRLLDRLGGLNEKDVRCRAEEFRASLPPLVLFILRLLAFPTLWALRFLQRLLGIDEQAIEQAKGCLEDVDCFIGRDRFD